MKINLPSIRSWSQCSPKGSGDRALSLQSLISIVGFKLPLELPSNPIALPDPKLHHLPCLSLLSSTKIQFLGQCSKAENPEHLRSWILPT
ncbi:hypothetical protein Mapa_001614 [Marchantia paleacea]|nr:hypothetical protein Mapa_001614 [Marchantia paleacea]